MPVVAHLSCHQSVIVTSDGSGCGPPARPKGQNLAHGSSVFSGAKPEPQAPVWHWPKCWGLRNVNNRQKCTKKNYQQSLNEIFLSSSGRLLKIQKLFIILTILKKNFFFEAKISTVWLQIKFKIYRQVEGATCQCQTGACATYPFRWWKVTFLAKTTSIYIS